MVAPARLTRSSLVAALVVAMLLAFFLWRRNERAPLQRGTEALSPLSGNIERTTEIAQLPTPGDESAAAAPASTPNGPRQRAHSPPQMTEEMRDRRQRVLDSFRGKAPASAASAPPPAAEVAAGMKDKTGVMGAEVKALNEQLLPLVAQCFDQAKERGVRQRGMLALSVKLAGAEGIGRIIESVEPAPGNAIDDHELIECVRQSSFTVDLPPPSTTSVSELEMTLPFEGAPDASAPASR